MYYNNHPQQYQPYDYNNHLSYRQFPQYPQSEKVAEQFIKQPMHPHLKDQTLSIVRPFVNYGLEEGKATSYKHAMTEIAAMTYLIGKGMDPQTAYLTVESWEVNETF
jgi:hypothetical protein